MKKKYVFVGDIDSINIEIINKSHKFLKNKVKYILLCNIKDVSKRLEKLRSSLAINEIHNPFNFQNTLFLLVKLRIMLHLLFKIILKIYIKMILKIYQLTL